jgi:hypothetical protein
VRNIGSTDICERCGKDYIVAGGLQRFCPDCASAHAAEYDRVTSIEYYHANKERINPIRNERRRIGYIKCRVCNKLFDPKGTRRKECSQKCRRKYVNRRWMHNYYRKKFKTGTGTKAPRNIGRNKLRPPKDGD